MRLITPNFAAFLALLLVTLTIALLLGHAYGVIQ